jgi:hypothetical protein
MPRCPECNKLISLRFPLHDCQSIVSKINQIVSQKPERVTEKRFKRTDPAPEIKCQFCGGLAVGNYKHRPGFFKCLGCHRTFWSK